MTVSIIMPFFNGKKCVIDTIESIINQTFKDWELLIIDDCSTNPDSLELLRKVSLSDERIRILKTQENGGAGVARNVGIENAAGRYIAFCDSDDWWYPEKLEKQLIFMQTNDYSFVCSYYEDADENLNPFYTMKQPLVMSAKDLKYGCSVGTPGVIYDTEIIGKVYMPPMRRGEDWSCWLKIIKKAKELHVYPEPLWKYRHLSASETSNKLLMTKNVIAVYRTAFGYSKLKSILITLFIFIPKNILKKVRKLN